MPLLDVGFGNFATALSDTADTASTDPYAVFAELSLANKEQQPLPAEPVASTPGGHVAEVPTSSAAASSTASASDDFGDFASSFALPPTTAGTPPGDIYAAFQEAAAPLPDSATQARDVQVSTAGDDFAPFTSSANAQVSTDFAPFTSSANPSTSSDAAFGAFAASEASSVGAFSGGQTVQTSTASAQGDIFAAFSSSASDMPSAKPPAPTTLEPQSASFKADVSGSVADNGGSVGSASDFQAFPSSRATSEDGSAGDKYDVAKGPGGVVGEPGDCSSSTFDPSFSGIALFLRLTRSRTRSMQHGRN